MMMMMMFFILFFILLFGLLLLLLLFDKAKIDVFGFEVDAKKLILILIFKNSFLDHVEQGFFF